MVVNSAAKNQHADNQAGDFPLDVSTQGGSKCFDDNGRLKRTGTVWTASAHIITAVIGSGVLSLAWAIAQLGWVAGPAVMLLFAFVTYYTSTLLYGVILAMNLRYRLILRANLTSDFIRRDLQLHSLIPFEWDASMEIKPQPALGS